MNQTSKNTKFYRENLKEKTTKSNSLIRRILQNCLCKHKIAGDTNPQVSHLQLKDAPTPYFIPTPKNKDASMPYFTSYYWKEATTPYKIVAFPNTTLPP